MKLFFFLFLTLHVICLSQDSTTVVDSLQIPQPIESVVLLPQPKTHGQLLPKNISFGEQLMWGENGLLRTVGIALPLTPAVRKHELDIRRTMLTAHQIGGFVTLGLMATTSYFGQRIIGGRKDLKDTHESFVGATVLSYGATGLLSVFSPPPVIRRDENSTTTLHKTLAWIHFAGILITPILAESVKNSGNPAQAQRMHQISGYITTAALATSLIVITF